MDEFLKEAEKLIDTDTFSLQSNDSMYQSMLEPLNNVASFSKMLFTSGCSRYYHTYSDHYDYHSGASA